MSFLLHTDMMLRHLRNHPAVSTRVMQHGGKLYCSVLSMTGVELVLTHWHTPLSLAQGYFTFLPQIVALNVDVHIAQEAARLGANFRAQGKRMPPAVELVIAATGLVHGLTLVTRSTGLFAGVAGLTVVDWTQP